MRKMFLFAILGLVACEGPEGPKGDAGDAGADGADGVNGQDGQNGSDGSDGAATLIATTEIDPGAECTFGGIRIDSGVDDNGDGVLDAGEIDATNFVCNGLTEDIDPATAPIATRQLSSMVAVALDQTSAFGSIPDYVKSLVDRYSEGETIFEGNFPLGVPSRSLDIAGELPNLKSNVVVSWFDAITPDRAADAPRFGANNDYLAYFGDDWDSDWTNGVVGSGPMFNGSPDGGWMWSNHEYISNAEPELNLAPQAGGQYETLALYLQANGLLNIADVTDDSQWTQALVDEHVTWEKKQHGGSWLRVERAFDGSWRMIPHADAKRYDSTDSTLARITGYTLNAQDTDDSGNALPQDVVVGITADCSGGQTPWGTVFTAEENAQSQWGDFETAWASDRQFILDNPEWGAGQNVSPIYTASDASEFGRHSDPNTKHAREVYGFLVEIDVGADPADYYESNATGGDGNGHRKLGAMGRARWENMDTVTDTNQELIDGQPIVLYGANDRRAGRVYKFVSAGTYTDGMTKAEVRELLDDGTLYVGHWEDLDALTGLTRFDESDPNWANCSGANINGPDGASLDTVIANCPALTEDNPGQGRWIELSTTSTDLAPNGAANGNAAQTVGAALQDVNWNGVGGFPTDNAVLGALFTASAKLGVRELNRPEDVEWNPFDQSLYIAFTYHGRTIGMKQDGTLVLRNTNGEKVDAAGTVLPNGEPLASRGVSDLHAFVRADNFGSIFRLVETNGANPSQSDTFTFYPVFFGSQGDSAFDTARPDNLAIDSDGGVWFGTDGNTSGSTNRSADGFHYLDLDPSHKAGEPGIVNPTYGVAFRVLNSANDAEATGPVFNSNEDTIFYNAQHPGEFRASSWPSSQPGIR